MRPQLDPKKLAKLHNTSELLDKKYGKRGTETREAFEERAYANYYTEILKEKRKELKLTQQELAERIGKQRSYIAQIERGLTDLQLSNLIRISNALGLQLSLD